MQRKDAKRIKKRNLGFELTQGLSDLNKIITARLRSRREELLVRRPPRAL
jgi:hypothetical protein